MVDHPISQLVGEVGDVVREVHAVGDVMAVEALAFQGLDPALDDAVDPRRSMAGADMGPVRAGGEPAGDRFYGRAAKLARRLLSKSRTAILSSQNPRSEACMSHEISITRQPPRPMITSANRKKQQG